MIDEWSVPLAQADRVVDRLEMEIIRLTTERDNWRNKWHAHQVAMSQAEEEVERITKRCEEARCLLTTTPMTSGILAWAEYMDRRDKWLEGKP